jgi:hypothetical protein
MAKTLTQIFTEHGAPQADWDDAKKMAFKKDMDAFDADVRRGATEQAARTAAQNQPPNPNAPPMAKIDPALQQTIDEMKGAIAGVTDALKNVVTYVKASEAEKAASQKATIEERYKKHVQKMADEGRFTKEQMDAYLKPEEMTKNLPSIDIFEQLTSQLPVNPAFKPASKPANSQQPAQQQQGAGEAKGLDQLRADAEAAFAQSSGQPGRL